MGQFQENHPSGAKAPRSFCGIYGTSELVPFQNCLKLTHSLPRTAEGRFFRRDTGDSGQKTGTSGRLWQKSRFPLVPKEQILASKRSSEAGQVRADTHRGRGEVMRATDRTGLRLAVLSGLALALASGVWAQSSGTASSPTPANTPAAQAPSGTDSGSGTQPTTTRPGTPASQPLQAVRQ